jgi:hypothetical protein
MEHGDESHYLWVTGSRTSTLISFLFNQVNMHEVRGKYSLGTIRIFLFEFYYERDSNWQLRKRRKMHWTASMRRCRTQVCTATEEGKIQH